MKESEIYQLCCIELQNAHNLILNEIQQREPTTKEEKLLLLDIVNIITSSNERVVKNLSFLNFLDKNPKVKLN